MKGGNNMFYGGRVKPSKAASFAGLIGGAIFVIISIAAIPSQLGLIKILFILFALWITIFHAVNAFGKKGISLWEFNFDNKEKQLENLDFESKLRKLDDLHKDGLINKEEFQRKRDEIMNQKW